MKKIILLCILIATIWANEKVSLQLKWKHSFQFAGFYMAKEKGFYKDAGLDVTLKELNSQTDLVDSVLNAKATYGVGDSTLIYHVLMKKPIMLMMPIFETTPLALLTTKNVHSLHDFKSKKIFINKFDLNSPAIVSMLHLADMDFKNFIPQTGVFSIQDMMQQKLDFFSVYTPNEPYYLKKHHIKYTLFRPKDYGLDFYGDMLFSSQQEIEKHFSRAIRFMDASKKGWEYALSHIDETIKIIEKKYNTQHFSTDELHYQAKEYKKFITKNFQFNRQKIENTKIIFKLLYKIKNDVAYEDFVLNRYIATKEEREFLKTHTIHCITTTNWAPFNLIKDGKVAGLGIDYWHIVADKLGIQRNCYKVHDFTTLLEDIKSKKADITISTSQTPEREKYAIFSKAYATFPIVIATKKDVDFIPSIKSIQDKTFALAKNHTATKLLLEKYPNLHYIETQSVKEALQLVKESKAYATVEILPVLAYKINTSNFNNIKISGKTELNFPVKFMIRKDYKTLLPMINRVIDSLDKETKKIIYDRWISVNVQTGYSEHKVNKFIRIAAAILVLFIIWVIILLYQIQKRKKAEVALEHLANFDALTSIYNRRKIERFLAKQMEIAKRYNRKLSVIFCDIDKFKHINDTFGHKTGDKILQEITQLISNKIRESDGFGRWGGEEFLIVSPETNLNQATVLAEKLRKSIESYNFPSVKHATCSFGVIEVDPKKSLDIIMKEVDAMLYKAKNSGRNKVVSNA